MFVLNRVWLVLRNSVTYGDILRGVSSLPEKISFAVSASCSIVSSCHSGSDGIDHVMTVVCFSHKFFRIRVACRIRLLCFGFAQNGCGSRCFPCAKARRGTERVLLCVLTFVPIGQSVLRKTIGNTFSTCQIMIFNKLKIVALSIKLHYIFR